jgi:hypothetical protein
MAVGVGLARDGGGGAVDDCLGEDERGRGAEEASFPVVVDDLGDATDLVPLGRSVESWSPAGRVNIDGVASCHRFLVGFAYDDTCLHHPTLYLG